MWCANINISQGIEIGAHFCAFILKFKSKCKLEQFELFKNKNKKIFNKKLDLRLLKNCCQKNVYCFTLNLYTSYNKESRRKKKTKFQYQSTFNDIPVLLDWQPI